MVVSPLRRKALFGLTACVVAVVLGYMAIFARKPAPRPPPPNPNGYDDFFKAATLVTGDIGNWGVLNKVELQRLITTNVEPLQLLQLGLSRQSALPADTVMTNASTMIDQLASLKRLAQLLAAKGRLREANEDLSGAAASYVETIHFGNEISRGGFIITRLVGLACEAIGESSLSTLVPKLKPAEARPVITELEQIDLAQVPWDEVKRNEARFVQYQLGKGFNPITWIMSRLGTWRAEKRAKLRDYRVVVHLRLLTTELALRCYQSELGQVPGSLDQLVPKYLQRVPSDPFSGKPLVYRPQGNHWLCYSVGEDMVDSGGKPVGRGLGAKGDISFDSQW